MKAKNRKPPDARDARVEAMPAVAFSIRGISDRCRIIAKDDESKKMARVQKKMNPGAGQKNSSHIGILVNWHTCCSP